MLQLSLITVSLDPESGEFPSRPLASVEGEIVSVVEHFFFHDGLPRLLLVVQHRSEEMVGGAKGRRRSVAKADPRRELSEDEAALYDRLRAWRRARAEAEGVPPYVIFNNREIAEVARRRPGTLTALQELDGIGRQKAQRYGRDLLVVVTAAPQNGDAKREPGDERA